MSATTLKIKDIANRFTKIGLEILAPTIIDREIGRLDIKKSSPLEISRDFGIGDALADYIFSIRNEIIGDFDEASIEKMREGVSRFQLCSPVGFNYVSGESFQQDFMGISKQFFLDMGNFCWLNSNQVTWMVDYLAQIISGRVIPDVEIFSHANFSLLMRSFAAFSWSGKLKLTISQKSLIFSLGLSHHPNPVDFICDIFDICEEATFLSIHDLRPHLWERWFQNLDREIIEEVSITEYKLAEISDYLIQNYSIDKDLLVKRMKVFC